MKKLSSLLFVLAVFLSMNINSAFSQDEFIKQEVTPKDEVRTPRPLNSLQQDSKIPLSNPFNSGNPILNMNPQKSPNAQIFFDGFESGNTQGVAPVGWTQASVAGSSSWLANTTQTTYNRTPRTGSWNAYLQYSNTDWMFKSVDLTGGQEYTLSFYARQDVTSGTNIQAKYGTEATIAGMTNNIISSTAVTNGDYQLFSGVFTPGATGTYYIGIRADLTSAPWYISIDDISLVSNTGMTFVSSTTEQGSTLPVVKGSTNNEIVRLKVVTDGNLNPFNVTSVTFNTTGTTSTSDITNARVYYTTAATFSTATPFGSAVPNPSGSFTVTGTQTLAGENNYFWLAYDVSGTATEYNVIDAQCTQFVTSEAKANRTPDVTDPGGSRTIRAPLSGVYTIDQGGSGTTNYTTFTAAIDELNLLGISGPVTFNVTSGQTWNSTVPASPYNYAYIIFTTGTEANPIVFQKSGGGANPKLNITGTSATNDFGVWIYGDYTTFNGIDVYDAGTTSTDYLDRGFYFQGPADNNCKYNTIKNSTVDLNKSNTSSYGVYLFANAPTSVANANNFNKFYNNTIQDAYSAYYFSGNSTYFDDGNEIGIDGGTSLIDNIGGSSSTVYVVYAPYETNFKLFNTTISNVTGSSSIYCFYDGLGATSTHQIYNNTFTNVTGTSTSTAIYGIYNTSDATFNMYNNVFKTFTAPYTVYPVYITTVTTSNIYNNKIYDIAYSGTSTSIAYGLHIGGGTTHYIYNNFIYDIKAPNATSSTTNANVRGLSLTGGTNAYVFYNTVYLDYTSAGATNQSAALYVGTSPTLDLRNNIFVNNVNVTTGTRAVAFYKTTSTLTNFATTSNNNLYFTGVLDGSAKNLIFYDATNSDQTLAAYKTRMATRDQNAATENPPFESTVAPYNLKLQTTIATQVESGGQRVTTPIAVTTDFENDIRQGETGYAGTGTAPDIGADEFNGIPIDINGPTITYTPLVNTASTANRVFSNVTITDPSGVDVGDLTKPRVYYKKSTDANTYAGNTNTDDGWKWVETTSGASPFSFTLDYSILNGGGVATGDVIQYFVIAQDIVAMPNVSIKSGTPAKAPTSVDLTDQEFPLTGTIYQYSIAGSVSGIILVGTGQTYTSLTANDATGLFKAINDGIVTGNLTVKIVSDLTETGAVALNQTTEEAIYTITVQPDAATMRTISGSYAGGLIRLNGADGITFDGRFEGTGSYLTFSNTSTSGSAVFQLISLGTNAGATNNTIRNCNISAGSITATTYGIFIGSATLGTAADDNDNNSILNNIFTKANYGIYARATATGVNNNLIITGNTIGSETATDYIGKYGVDVAQATSADISQNTIFNFIGTITNPTGILITTGVTNSSINRNKIHSLKYTGTTGYGGKGIDVATGSNTSNLTISNNLIYDISGDGYSTGSSDAIYGIRIQSSQGGINIYYNTVNLYGSITRSSATVDQNYALYIGSSVVSLNIVNNILSNSIENTTGVSTSYAIFSASANTAFTAINYNDYYASGVEGVLGYLSANKTTLPDWAAASGGDANSIAANPSFVANNDLQPSVGSPVLAAGTPVSITVDYTGAARNGTTPSMGAYESPFLPILPPNCAVISSPSNSGTSISIAATLNWTDGGGGTTGYKLSFGTDNPPTNILNNSDLGNVTTYDPVGDLLYSTTYYWKVTAYNANGDATGCNVWSFTTQFNPNFGGNGQTGNNLYYFANSTPGGSGSPTQPTFNWIDPSGGTDLIVNSVGTPTSGTVDDGYFTVSAGLPPGSFRLFGTDYTTVYIGTNGFVSFDAGYTAYTPSAIPSAGTPNNAIYGLWCDLRYNSVLVLENKLTYKVVGNDLIITYLNAPTTIAGATDYVSFQIILTFSESPAINSTFKIQYDDSKSGDGWKNATTGQYYTNGIDHLVGVEGAGTAGTALQYRFVTGGSVVSNGPLISSPVAIAMGPSEGALPVTLSSFTSNVNVRDVKLNWITASEINNAGFDIERSDAGINHWVKAGYVSGKGTTSTPTTYTFEDKKLNSGKYNYRLKQIDNNGNYTYYNLSNQVEVGLPTKFDISQNYPNPFNPVTKIDFSLPLDAKVSIKLYDITGREIKTLVNDQRTAGYYTVQFNGSDISSGTYFYRIMTKSSGADYIMTKKMVLIK